ncbi:MAG: deoxyribonuclease V [Acidobacteria bacterium]|nr:deoxyribonuclease V [Acidobacteriota bacterium]
MKLPPERHRWDLTPKEAVELQRRLAGEIETEDRLGSIRHVAGVDVGFEDRNTITRAAVAVLSYPDLELVDHAIARRPTSFPYVPGLLSFREIPAVLDALGEISQAPDVFLCDGQGLAHPRRFGIACHLGWWLDLPTIGVGKSRLVGDHDELGEERGATTPLLHRGETIGTLLRSRTGVKPLYVSPGHRVSHETAVRLTLACTPRYRLPETTRWAHKLASG